MVIDKADEVDISIDEQYRLLAGEIYEPLRQRNAADKVYSRIHPEALNLEYIAALNDQADLAFGIDVAATPEERARRFLIGHYQLFSFYRAPADGSRDAEWQRGQFASQLFLKHSLSSLMGTHCVFGWRLAGVEALDYSVVVHLDRNARVVMVTSVYLPGVVDEAVNLEDAWAKLRKWLDPKRGKGPSKNYSKPVVDRVIVRARDKQRGFQYALRAKLSTGAGDLVTLFDNQGQLLQYRLSPRAAPAQLGLARVYSAFSLIADPAAPVLPADQLEDTGQTCTVLLRGLQSESDLIGVYVTVNDQAMAAPFDTRTANFESLPLLQSSYFDRQMAYVHLDLIQRHFRDLGIQILDEYTDMNPVQVVLGQSTETCYSVNEQRIYIGKLAAKATNARDARILYHEFVHVVTDALARLRRDDAATTDPLRVVQVMQAAAMDEGLADYFACSLAARAGAPDASFYPPPQVREEGGALTLAWNVTDPASKHVLSRVRSLGGARDQGYPKLAYDDLSSAAQPTDRAGAPTAEPIDPAEIEQQIYRWAELWGRYLWSLRCALSPDVADTLIAHSIFFLTRWSSFGAGVLAIAMVDRLLFAAAHETAILELGAPMRDWSDREQVRQHAAPAAKPPAEQKRQEANYIANSAPPEQNREVAA